MPKLPKLSTIRNVASRTPDEDFRARLVCFHEAGHVVAGHALGWRVRKVTVGITHFEPVARLPLVGVDEPERSRRVDQTRRAMAVVSAGHVAATIHQRAVRRGGYSCPQEARAYRTSRATRISDMYPAPAEDEGLDSDCVTVVLDASIIASLALPSPPPRGEVAAVGRAHVRAVRGEILSAERAAEAILRRYWPAVCDVALALHRSRVGWLTRGQLRRRLDRYFLPEKENETARGSVREAQEPARLLGGVSPVLVPGRRRAVRPRSASPG